MSDTSKAEPYWIEACAAAAHIRQRFGVENALEYIVGEKFTNFLNGAQRSAERMAELDGFAAEIREIFTPKELLDFLKKSKRRPGSNRRRDLLDDAVAHLVTFRFVPPKK